MKFIVHRCNTIAKLKDTLPTYGVEIDVRSNNNRLIIHHDPFAEGEDIEAWLKEFCHDTLILNVKEEGLEDRLLSLMKKYDIDNFFLP